MSKSLKTNGNPRKPGAPLDRQKNRGRINRFILPPAFCACARSAAPRPPPRRRHNPCLRTERGNVQNKCYHEWQPVHPRRAHSMLRGTAAGHGPGVEPRWGGGGRRGFPKNKENALVGLDVVICIYVYTYVYICMYICMYVCMCIYIGPLSFDWELGK